MRIYLLAISLSLSRLPLGGDRGEREIAEFLFSQCPREHSPLTLLFGGQRLAKLGSLLCEEKEDTLLLRAAFFLR